MNRPQGEMITITGESFKKDLCKVLAEKMNLSMEEASVKILRNGKNYISKSCITGRIGRSEYETLCVVAGLDESKYIPEEKKEEPHKENKPDVIVGMNSIYNLLNKIYSEMKTTNDILREMSRKEDNSRKMIETINSNTNKATEKITSIFTDVHYKLR